MLCGNNVSTLHRFGDITTFTIHVIACDLGKSFSFDKTVKLEAYKLCTHNLATLASAVLEI